MKAACITTERLKLVPLSLLHLSQEYVDWMNDGEVNKYLESGGNYTIEKLRAFIEEQEKKEILFWAIHLKDGLAHIGNIKVDPINQESKSGEYGILMGSKKHWGKGYAFEASQGVINFCFKEAMLQKITLGVINHNELALRLYLKLGFSIKDYVETEKLYEGKTSEIIRMQKVCAVNSF